MKKKFNWTTKSKHVLIVMILVCISLMIFANRLLNFQQRLCEMRQDM